MCSNNTRKLENIKDIISRTIEPKIMSKILFISPTDLFDNLDTIMVSDKPNKENRIKGYRVKVKYK